MPDASSCGACGAPWEGDEAACRFCASSRPGATPPLPRADPAKAMREARETLARVQGALDEPAAGTAPFHFLHGSIFILVGAAFTATLIGAIVGIPAILIGVRSWRRGLAAMRA